MGRTPGSDGVAGIERDYIISRLADEFGYPAEGAHLVADKLAACAGEVQASFHKWWTTGHLDVLEVEQYTVQRLMNEHGMNPVAAFLTLDWLIREPEKARTSLARGHDVLT